MYFEYLLIIGLSLCLLGLLWKLSACLREISKLEKVYAGKEKELKDRSEKIINDANATAMRLIQEAHLHAENIEKELDKKLDAVNLEELNNYKETIQNISKDIRDTAMREIKEMESLLKNETVGVQEIVGKKVDEALSNALAEINTYKDKKISEINNRMLSFVKELSLKTLGKGLSISDNEDFVYAALKEAKEGHVF